ncbi:hypothetical protein O4H53_04890 [Sulfitobacter sp. G21635-S1]|uniref:hypothetical protein n=1 Tax=Sulfitobacter sp. G21635-S1 TaxID=3014043 RepID=UPI0022B073F0|nr:hypothetical protein [Sulfitobacter sp. G21635-S1]MCZ4254865.1 hypothetical protein [Sulfitobacter sp. G21635-S1]
MIFNTKLPATVMALCLLALPAGAQTELATGDQYIDGRLCVGVACNGTEQYALHSLIMKDTKPSLLFEDTSVNGFPTADWIIEVGGDFPERLYFRSLDTFTTPFQIEAGAPNNALYIQDDGDVGIGTTLPQNQLHIVGAGSSVIRLESTTPAPQSWLMQGFPSIFAITDITNGSSLLGLETGAPPASLYVDDGGFVGLGTNTPEEKLHIVSNTDGVDAFALFDARGDRADAAFLLRQDGQIPTTWEFRNQEDSGRLNIGIAGGNTPLKIDNLADNNLLRLGRNGRPDEVVVTGTLVVNNTDMNVPDYVFAEDYALRPLAEVRAFIDANSHLPEVPSEAEIRANGVDMTAMQMTLLKKVEELTLYTLAQEERAAEQDSTIARQQREARAQEALIASLARRIEALEGH